MRVLACFIFSSLAAVASCSRLTPGVLPLIVRNPYLSTWLRDARGNPWETWPIHWSGQDVGLSVLASNPQTRTAYPLLGRPQDSLRHSGDDGYNVSYALYGGATYDASTTNLTYHIAIPRHPSRSIEIVLSFLSPITPTSTVRQSIPASYLTVYVTGSSNIDIYVDLNGHWVTGDRGNGIIWELENHAMKGGQPALKTWKFKRETEQQFTEWNDRAEWGTLHFTGPADVRHESGTSALLRQRFSRTGTLQNQIDDKPRKIMDNEPVFAFSKSFHANETYRPNSSTQSVTFTIAHLQNPVTQFASARGLTFMRPLWNSYFFTDDDLLTFHYLDFHNAKALANNYSAQLAIDAYKSGSHDYVDIVALSARQTLGGTIFAGTPEDPILFLKEISSDGNCQTIDVIFPAFPFFLYTNPRWLAYLLEPLIEHMLSGQYPNDYAMHDLGSHFPNVTGHPYGRDEYMPVEECGNILIMGLALVNSLRDKIDVPEVSTWQPDRSPVQIGSFNDKVFPLATGHEDSVLYIDEHWGGGPQSKKQARKWVERSYKLWKQWTGYLVRYSLQPANQLSTDDFAGWLALQTNLALKGIIGIKAMEGLARVVDNEADAKIYKNISKVYIKKWEEYGMSRDGTHAKVAYNWYGSWTTTYNLYADALLCFHLGDDFRNTSISASSALDTSTAPISPEPLDSQIAHPVPRHHPHYPAQGQSPLHLPQPASSSKHPKLPPNDTLGFVPRHIYQSQSDFYYLVRQTYGLPLDSRHLYAKTDWEIFAMAVSAPRVRSTILTSMAKWVNESEVTDRPLTDLYDTEVRGGWPRDGPRFYARPVVGGHFAILALERACGGRGAEGFGDGKDGWIEDGVVDRAVGGDEWEDEIKEMLRRDVADPWNDIEDLWEQFDGSGG